MSTNHFSINNNEDNVGGDVIINNNNNEEEDEVIMFENNNDNNLRIMVDAHHQQQQQHGILVSNNNEQHEDEQFDLNNEVAETIGIQQQQQHLPTESIGRHSYLPGTVHPLLSVPTTTGTMLMNDSNLTTTNNSSNNRRGNDCYVSLAILELPDIVLFPGRTLPIRITNRKWIQYIGKQIDQLRNSSNTLDKNNTIRIGILCRSSSLATARSTTTTNSAFGIRRRMREQQEQEEQHEHQQQQQSSPTTPNRRSRFFFGSSRRELSASLNTPSSSSTSASSTSNTNENSRNNNNNDNNSTRSRNITRRNTNRTTTNDNNNDRRTSSINSSINSNMNSSMNSNTSSNTNTTATNDGTRRPSANLRRQSWTRQGYGPVRMERFSARLIEELGQDFLLDDDSDDENESSSNNNTNNNDIINNNRNSGGVVVAASRTNPTNENNDQDRFFDCYDDEPNKDDDDEEVDHYKDPTGNTSTPNKDATTTSNLFQQRFKRQQEYIQYRRRIRTNGELVGRIGTIATIVATHGDSIDEQHQQQRNRFVFPPSTSSTTIPTNHTIPQPSSSQLWRQNEYATELIVTVVGTSRFRIVVPSTSTIDNNNYNPTTTEIVKHWVEELGTEPPEASSSISSSSSSTLPNNTNHIFVDNTYSNRFSTSTIGPDWKRRIIASATTSSTASTLSSFTKNDNNNNNNSNQQQQYQSLFYHHQQHLQHISYIPTTLIYRSIWPFQLVNQIVLLMKEIPSLSTLLQQQQQQHSDANGTSTAATTTNSSIKRNMNNMIDDQNNNIRILEPYHFGYWIASNLVLEMDEKLDVLELNSTIDVLLYVYHKIKQYYQNEYQLTIHCKCCGYPIAYASSMFIVGGCKRIPTSSSTTSTTTTTNNGTTIGNYVNEHGIVHQTITVRQLAVASKHIKTSTNNNNNNNNNNNRTNHHHQQQQQPSNNRQLSTSSSRMNHQTSTIPTTGNRNNNFPRLLRNHPHFLYQTSSSSSDNYNNNNSNRTMIIEEWLEECEIVTYTGYPQRKDSWFTGYTWLIMSCAFCTNHLGWKFQKEEQEIQQEQDHQEVVEQYNDNTTDRPNYFFGLSSANVTTFLRRRP